MDAGLFLLRLVAGLTLAAHGAQKLFGWFGGYGIAGTGGWLESLGFRPGKIHAVLNGLAELGGGLLLALGLATPAGAAAAIGVMTVAIWTVHRTKGFFNTEGGYEFPLLLAASAETLAFTGAGRYSLDALAGLPFGGIEWGLAALAVGLLLGLVILAERRTRTATASA